MQEFLRPREVAARLGVSRSTAYDLIARGVIPSIRLSRKVLRVPAAALVELERKALEGGGDPR